MGFEKISPRDIEGNPFRMIGDKWMLVTAGDKNGYNTMTASWGGLGVLWRLEAATCYVRPSRYTYEFLEKNEYYTLSFYGEQYRRELGVLGAKSGRDCDKIKECGFTVRFADCGAPYFEQAELVLVCKKMYYGDFEPKNAVSESAAQFYEDGDWHRMYIGEIVEALIKR